MKMSTCLLVLGLTLSLVAGSAGASMVAVFNNGSYSDTSGEVPNLTGSLASLSHTVNNFSGIGAADFAAATAGADALIIPELEVGDLYAALTPGAVTEIQNYVAGGGNIITFGTWHNNGYVESLLNNVFDDFALTIPMDQTYAGANLDVGNAAGTSFEGCPNWIPRANSTNGYELSELPGGALSFYSGIETYTGNEVSVAFASSYGAGSVIYLGFDWFEMPVPSEWECVLNAAVTYDGGDPVPEPASLTLMGLGLAGFVGRRIRKKNI